MLFAQCFYCWFEVVPLVFGNIYAFSLGAQGLVFAGFVVAALIVYVCTLYSPVVTPFADSGTQSTYSTNGIGFTRGRRQLVPISFPRCAGRKSWWQMR